jgi:hypothetical protein
MASTTQATTQPTTRTTRRGLMQVAVALLLASSVAGAILPAARATDDSNDRDLSGLICAAAGGSGSSGSMRTTM